MCAQTGETSRDNKQLLAHRDFLIQHVKLAASRLFDVRAMDSRRKPRHVGHVQAAIAKTLNHWTTESLECLFEKLYAAMMLNTPIGNTLVEGMDPESEGPATLVTMHDTIEARLVTEGLHGLDIVGLDLKPPLRLHDQRVAELVTHPEVNRTTAIVTAIAVSIAGEFTCPLRCGAVYLSTLTAPPPPAHHQHAAAAATTHPHPHTHTHTHTHPTSLASKRGTDGFPAGGDAAGGGGGGAVWGSEMRADVFGLADQSLVEAMSGLASAEQVKEACAEGRLPPIVSHTSTTAGEYIEFERPVGDCMLRSGGSARRAYQAECPAALRGAKQSEARYTPGSRSLTLTKPVGGEHSEPPPAGALQCWAGTGAARRQRQGIRLWRAVAPAAPAAGGLVQPGSLTPRDTRDDSVVHGAPSSEHDTGGAPADGSLHTGWWTARGATARVSQALDKTAKRPAPGRDVTPRSQALDKTAKRPAPRSGCDAPVATPYERDTAPAAPMPGSSRSVGGGGTPPHGRRAGDTCCFACGRFYPSAPAVGDMPFIDEHHAQQQQLQQQQQLERLQQEEEEAAHLLAQGAQSHQPPDQQLGPGQAAAQQRLQRKQLQKQKVLLRRQQLQREQQLEVTQQIQVRIIEQQRLSAQQMTQLQRRVDGAQAQPVLLQQLRQEMQQVEHDATSLRDWQQELDKQVQALLTQARSGVPPSEADGTCPPGGSGSDGEGGSEDEGSDADEGGANGAHDDLGDVMDMMSGWAHEGGMDSEDDEGMFAGDEDPLNAPEDPGVAETSSSSGDGSGSSSSGDDDKGVGGEQPGVGQAGMGVEGEEDGGSEGEDEGAGHEEMQQNIELLEEFVSEMGMMVLSETVLSVQRAVRAADAEAAAAKAAAAASRAGVCSAASGSAGREGMLRGSGAAAQQRNDPNQAGPGSARGHPHAGGGGGAARGKPRGSGGDPGHPTAPPAGPGCSTPLGGSSSADRGGGGGGARFLPASPDTQDCDVFQEPCTFGCKSKLRIALKQHWAGNLSLVKLIDSDDRMTESNDDHTHPNIDIQYCAMKGVALQLPAGMTLL
ncbi:MAG: hypothetical protein WDW36_006326 [Sanguina aurantia]